ncbi:uncharacterized protein IL334_005529 [Kwoniella shivajii]|uniref:Gylcosyl hydrolase 115 C-terminal domain-containing protein n=1 Tax=Kwoniella shivajii TaxID=564305 RepID=A0ABZ1D4P6_9TREE|nr:hypothetical protein IL334_005529 [Kwoniella shivajii]
MRLISSLVVACGLSARLTSALGEKRVIAFPPDSLEQPSSTSQTVFSSTDQKSSDHFLLASRSERYAAPLLLSSSDDIAIHIAAQAFAHDVYRVTGIRPHIFNDSLPHDVQRAIIVGTADNEFVRHLRTSEYAEDLVGKWESYDVRVAEKPIHGVETGLVVVGSDRRGAMYALYTLTEQFGVSPFHFWADVPVRPQDNLAYLSSEILSHGEPTVKYRGLFINDEHPALWSWAAQRYKVRWGEPAFLPDMYEMWFDMMLRLKANYFWPAMYASMFDVDGLNVTEGFPKEPIPGPNQVLANNMAIVMGTSHHEPMARNKPEWDREGKGTWDWTNDEFLTNWWTYGAERAVGKETMFTLGMRGDGDMPLTGASNALVENITSVQQGILKKTQGKELSDIPQMWCMYKEVAEYYINGLQVPEDVITLFADDNWGNVMTVQPPGTEHKAGAGIYYHVDYVGMPRAYKWINTINLAKTWEQMTIAAAFNTTSIWILNIGSLKPLELPTEHFLSLAWDLDAWGINSVERFLQLWAEREFGSKDKEEVADIMMKYSMYSSRRKAEDVYQSLPEDTKPAFYEQVYLLCLFQTNLNKIYIAAERSNLYAAQGRNSANIYAKQATEAFFHDSELTESFHSMLDRKWDHMLDQTHIGWNSWLEPIKDIMPPVSFVNPSSYAREGIPIPELGYGVITNIRVTYENSRGSWPGNTAFNCAKGEHCDTPELLPLDPFGAKSRWIDVGAAGPRTTKWKVKSDDWIIVEPREGKVKMDGSEDTRIRVSVDWKKAPKSGKGTFHLEASDGSEVTILVPVSNYSRPPKSFSGHVQGDGYVAIEAGHHVGNTSKEAYAFHEMIGYGRTLSGLEMFPRTTQNFTAGEGPSLSYDFWAHEAQEVEINIQIGPTLNFLGKNNTLAFGFQIDDQPVKTINPIPIEPLGFARDRPYNKPVAIGAVPKDWIEIVKNEIREVTLTAELDKEGEHKITLYGMTTGIVFERILVDFGGIKERGYSYLGPPESVRV